jgi:hypothetical protein
LLRILDILDGPFLMFNVSNQREKREKATKAAFGTDISTETPYQEKKFIYYTNSFHFSTWHGGVIVFLSKQLADMQQISTWMSEEMYLHGGHDKANNGSDHPNNSHPRAVFSLFYF